MALEEKEIQNGPVTELPKGQKRWEAEGKVASIIITWQRVDLGSTAGFYTKQSEKAFPKTFCWSYG